MFHAVGFVWCSTWSLPSVTSSLQCKDKLTFYAVSPNGVAHLPVHLFQSSSRLPFHGLVGLGKLFVLISVLISVDMNIKLLAVVAVS